MSKKYLIIVTLIFAIVSTAITVFACNTDYNKGLVEVPNENYAQDFNTEEENTSLDSQQNVDIDNLVDIADVNKPEETIDNLVDIVEVNKPEEPVGNLVDIVDVNKPEETIDNLVDIVEILNKEEIIRSYEQALISRKYYTSKVSQYTVIINGVECHQEMYGAFVYDGKVISENVEEIVGYNVLKKYITQYYISCIKDGLYTEKLGNMHYAVMTDTGYMCYITSGGMLACNGYILYDSLAFLDGPIHGEIIYKHTFTAITVDANFYYVYSFGEIVDVINIHTGGHPLG